VTLYGGEYGLCGLFFNAIANPFMSIISGSTGTGAGVALGIAILYQFLIGFFWFFGLNGSSVVNGAFLPFLLMMLTTNTSTVAQMGYNAADAAGALNIVSIQFIESYSQTTG
jgi:PTS system cellobiose-specific IIC component